MVSKPTPKSWEFGLNPELFCQQSPRNPDYAALIQATVYDVINDESTLIGLHDASRSNNSRASPHLLQKSAVNAKGLVRQTSDLERR